MIISKGPHYALRDTLTGKFYLNPMATDGKKVLAMDNEIPKTYGKTSPLKRHMTYTTGFWNSILNWLLSGDADVEHAGWTQEDINYINDRKGLDHYGMEIVEVELVCRAK